MQVGGVGQRHIFNACDVAVSRKTEHRGKVAIFSRPDVFRAFVSPFDQGLNAILAGFQADNPARCQGFGPGVLVQEALMLIIDKHLGATAVFAAGLDHGFRIGKPVRPAPVPRFYDAAWTDVNPLAIVLPKFGIGQRDWFGLNDGSVINLPGFCVFEISANLNIGNSDKPSDGADIHALCAQLADQESASFGHPRD